ncbi:MAG: gliding motility-associated C-terminal domain-containing protein [Bacteroidetes bacterium]|nr:gliding motility-associated C-terminal domain-containing protein [Bacteroidota bacterium]
MKQLSLFVFFCFLIYSESFSKAYYWVGGAGQWNDISHWSNKSGGAGGAGMPTNSDNVFFDNNSFTANGQVVSIDQTAVCKNMVWKDISYSPVLSASLTSTLLIYGSFSFSSKIINHFEGKMFFKSTQRGNAIFTANQIIHGSIYFDGSHGSWKLIDDIRTDGDASVFLIKGALNTNNKNIYSQAFIGSGKEKRSLSLGNSKIIVRQQWDFNNTANLTFDAGTSTVILPKEKTDNTFLHGNLRYSNLSVAAGNCSPSGDACAFFTITLTKTDVLCNGNCDGTVNAVVTGGTGPFTYNWAPGGCHTSSCSGLCLQNYLVEVIDSLGNNCYCSISVGTPLVLYVSSFSVITPSCNNDCNGSATATPFGGTMPYTYLWDNGQTTQTATGLCAGTYKATVSDSNGCITIANVIVTQPMALSANASFTPTDCWGSCIGSASVVPLGGTSPYTYNWMTSGATTSSITGLCDLSSYTIEVTDAKGCTAADSITITTTAPPTLTITGTPAGCTVSSGTATADLSGGISPYAYAWSNTQTTQTTTGLSAGKYFITVTDSNGCTVNDSVAIGITAPPTVTVTGTPAGCTVSSGTATANPSGGIFPYAYAWGNTQTTQTTTGLSAGKYFITVTDSNGCTVNDSVAIGITAPPTLTITGTPAGCTVSNGTATANPSGGVYPYVYAWNNMQTTQTATGLSAGKYFITVTDSNGCTVNDSVTIGITAPPTLTVAETPAGCTVSNGTATANPSGGVSPYTYLWGNLETTQTISGLAVGTYSVLVTDNNGCTANDSVFVSSTAPPTVPFTVTPAGCTVSNGTTKANPSGGVSPYTYLWDNLETTQTISGLAVGTYSVLVTDNNGCTKTSTVSVPSTTPPSISFTTTQAGCTVSNGTAIANPVGGVAPYTYLWGNLASTRTISGLAVGTYSVLVTDNNGCTKTATVSVSSTAPPSVIINGMQTGCSVSSSNGIVTAEPSGGVGSYTYLWSNMQTAKTISGLAVGSYSVLITDANGCTKGSSLIAIPQVQPVVVDSATQNNASCNGNSNGSASVYISGGNIPYTYSWNNSQTTKTATGLVAGTYSILVTDPYGCTLQSIFVITEPPPLSFNISVIDSLCQGSSGILSANPSGGTPPYTFTWLPGLLTGYSVTISPNITTTYIVNVTDSNGCTTTAQTFSVVVLPNPIAGFTMDSSRLFSRVYTFTDLSKSAISWHWDFGDGNVSSERNPVYNFPGPGTYPVTQLVTNKFGCTDTLLLLLNIPENFLTPNVFTPDGDGVNDIFFFPNSGIEEYLITIYDRWGIKVYESSDPEDGWDGKSTSGIILPAGTYFYTMKGLRLTLSGSSDENLRGYITLLK